jgi:hypothetical protein
MSNYQKVSSASDLISEIDKLLVALVAVQDADRYPYSPWLTDEERSDVILLGTWLARYHGLESSRDNKFAIYDRQEFIAGAAADGIPIHSDQSVQDALVDLVFQCFVRDPAEYNQTRELPWRISQMAYSMAVKDGTADETFRAFAENRLPESSHVPLWQEDGDFEPHQYARRTYRILKAVGELREEIRSLPTLSALFDLYKQLPLYGDALVNAGEHLELHQRLFDAKISSLWDYKSELVNHTGDMMYTVDEKWMLRTCHEDALKRTNSARNSKRRKGASGNPNVTDGMELVRAALLTYHRYATHDLLMDPIGPTALAKAANVSPATCSRFFKKYFRKHRDYLAVCNKGVEALRVALDVVNQERSKFYLRTNNDIAMELATANAVVDPAFD